ncbi:MAG: outer membrane protein assembly factor BamD [Prevotella sp.]|jgi:outer membrane protein assembly factor BamD
MRKQAIAALLPLLLLSGCAKEFNNVYKSQDYKYKYEYAKESFALGKYQRAATLLQDLIIPEKGSQDAQECLYMLGMAEYKNMDYETASETFKKYVQSYPRGQYAEIAKYYVGQSLYMSTPEPRLDQTQTINAINAFQEYLDLYPDAKYKEDAQNKLFALQDKLVKKELYSAELYYNLGTYFGNCMGDDGGNNYEACIVTSQNALKDYPYTKLRENFASLIMKSKFHLAEQSVESKKIERYQDAEDECYGFLNEYPDSKEKKTAEEFIEKCKKVTANAKD